VAQILETCRFGRSCRDRFPIGPEFRPSTRSSSRKRRLPQATFRLAALLSLVASGCADGRADPLAFVGEVPIPVPLLESLGEPERQSLADLVAFGAAVAEERAEEIVGPAIRAAVERRRLEALAYHLAARDLGLEGEHLRSTYDRSPEWELDVRHVVRLAEPSAPAAVRESARAIAESVAARASAGEDFAALAAEFSEEPGAPARGGLLQPGREGSWVDPFWQAASALTPGSVSGVVTTEYGYHVLRLEGRRPVPFEEASTTALLRRTIPATTAADAMEHWAISRGAVLVDPPALATARSALTQGRPVPDALEIVGSTDGDVYSGSELVAGWAGLSPDARIQLERADEASFAAWVEADARNALWARAAEHLGVDPPAGAETEARALWNHRLAGWARTFGFESGQPPATILEAARAGALSGTTETRAARAELRSLRPRLRAIYPVVEPES